MLLTSQEEIQRTGTLKVVGFGEVRVKPDTAWVHLRIAARGATTDEALRENRERVEQVLGTLRALGVTSLQRGEPESFPLAPHAAARSAQGPAPSAGAVAQKTASKAAARGDASGYGAESYVTVRTDVEQAGRLLAEGIRAGASPTSSISFGLRDEAPVRKQALDVAVRSAYTEAQLIAEAAGMRLQGPHSLDVARGGDPLITICPSETSHAGGAATAPASLILSAQVTADYTYLFEGREAPRRRRLNS
ncbi:MAG: SIMPL domain-containing protein [Polyangia bacterium]